MHRQSVRLTLSLFSSSLSGRAARLGEEHGSSAKAWDRVYSAIDLKMRASTASHRRSVDLGRLVPADEALAVFRLLLDTVWDVLRNRLDDQRQASEVFCAISRRVRGLLPIQVIDQQAQSDE